MDPPPFMKYLSMDVLMHMSIKEEKSRQFETTKGPKHLDPLRLKIVLVLYLNSVHDL